MESAGTHRRGDRVGGDADAGGRPAPQAGRQILPGVLKRDVREGA